MEKTKNMFLTSAKELKTTSTLAVCAMLAALALILNSVASINIGPYVKIGFSGIPNQIADYLFGPVTGCLFAGVLDIVKFFIRPDGPFSLASPLMQCSRHLFTDVFTTSINSPSAVY